MGGMIKYEWKKIWKNRLTQISMIGCSLFLLFCVYMTIIQITTTDENGQAISGMSAVERLKNIQQRQELTQDRVDEIVNQYLTYIHDPNTSSNNEAYYYLSEEQYKKFFLPNRDLLMLIIEIYREPGRGESTRDVLERTVGKDFRQARLERDLKVIHLKEELGRITSKEADYWEKEAEKISEYQYGYQKGWEMILNTLSWSVMIMMIICIGIAPIFSGEYQSKCDSLFLCMKYNVNNLVCAWNKCH